jgi:hypothetical protein
MVDAAKLTTVTSPTISQDVTTNADLNQPIAVVNTSNGWFGKVNVTQVVQLLATVAVIVSGGRFDITPEQQLQLVGAIVLIGNIATILFKVFYTPKVARQSIVKEAGGVAG